MAAALASLTEKLEDALQTAARIAYMWYR